MTSLRVFATRWIVFVCFATASFWSYSLSGHVPIPDSVLNPQSIPEAWNVLRLAVANIERLLSEDRLAEVPDQASLCSPALRTLARLAGAAQQKEVAVATVRASAAVSSLAQACVAGDRVNADTDLGKLRTDLAALAAGTDPAIVNAEVYFCQMHPEVVSLDARALCPKCGMPLTPRRIPYSFVYAAPAGEPSMRLTAGCDVPVLAGRPMNVKVRLTMRDGSPVDTTNLLIAHTQRVHLLIIDPLLEDYHHEHPVPTGLPGEYAFKFTPAKTAPYRIYADVVPVSTGVQEYVPTDLPCADAPQVVDSASPDRPTQLEVQSKNLQFRFETGEAKGSLVRSRQTCTLRVEIRDEHGTPFARLEPVMNAFAHLVGFYDDRRTVVHLHPFGPEVTDPDLRGGPALEFRFYPPRAGHLRLFCQVQVGGEAVFAPFDMIVVP